jgi:hypothetical protein
MVFGTMADLRASLTQRKTVDPDHPLLVAARDRLEDEPADRRAQFDVIAARISVGHAEQGPRRLRPHGAGASAMWTAARSSMST